MRKDLKWLVLGCVVVFPVVAGISLWKYNHRTDVMLRRELARIAAEGGPINTADLIPKKIPDAINRAVAYQKAFELISTPEAKAEAKLIAKWLRSTIASEGEVDWDQMARFVSKYEGAVNLAEQAQRLPDCQFLPVDDGVGPCGFLFPYIPKLRDMTRITSASAIISARNGRVDDALRKVRVAFKLSDSWIEIPSIVEYLVRIALIRMASNSLRQCLTYGDLPKQGAIRLADELASIDVSSELQTALKADRVIAFWSFDLFRSNWSESVYAGIDASDGDYSALCDADELYYLTKVRASIETSRMSYRDAVQQKCDIGVPTDIPKEALFSKVLLSAVGGPMKCRDTAQAELNGSRIALALAIYHTRHKSYPASLNDLATILGGKVPLDPFSAKPFVYKQQGTGYLFYSIGPNLKDDGGKRSSKDEGDLLWAVK